ncbi:MAG: CPBP family intramembrane metalloprotease [bacterium]|nr:CPBP family intramembrane metalloprotease [bacterium]
MSPEVGPVSRLWRKLPASLRAVLSGLFVFFALQLGWNVLAVANMRLFPHIPWSAPLVLVYLWVVFRFFSGAWGPASTSARRRAAMGARRLSAREWRAVLPTCLAAVVFIISTTILLYRIIEVPGDAAAMPELPWWSQYVMLLMISLVAGVSEEAGFRGYMLGGLLRRHGAGVAVGVSSVMFWLAHLNHASGYARAVSLILMGATLSYLTICTRSILPAIVAHATADSTVFIGAAAGIGPDYIWSPLPLARTGLDTYFWILLLLSIVSCLAGAAMLSRDRSGAAVECRA